MNYLILFILLFFVYGKRCIIYENSTQVNVSSIMSQVDPNITPEIIYDSTKVNLTDLIECGNNITNDTQIIYYIRNIETLQGFNTSDPTISNWLAFGKNYDGLCTNPLTTTIALACKLYESSTAFVNSTRGFFYPHFNNTDLSDRLNVSALLLSRIVNYPTIFNEGSIQRINYSAILDASFLYSVLPHVSNYQPQTLTFVKNTFYNLYNGNHKHLKRSFNRTIKSFNNAIPFKSIKHLYQSGKLGKMTKDYLNTLEKDFHETTGHFGNIIYHYESIEYSHHPNHSTFQKMNSWLHYMNKNDYKKSQAFKFRHSNSKIRRWQNLADPDNIIHLSYFWDVVNALGSFFSYLFWQNNDYNLNNCLQQPTGEYSPWIPEPTIQCQTPVFEGSAAINIWVSLFFLIF
jgi:hypothetical protein